MFSGLVTLTLFDTVSVAMTFFTIVLVHFINTTLASAATKTATAPTLASPTIKRSTSIVTTTPIPTTPTTRTVFKAVSLDEVLPLGATSTPATPTTTGADTTKKKLFKQKSENCEDLLSSSCVNSSSPNSSARNSTNLSNNGSILPHPPSTDCLYDEYHEDEDTLSLENLFPCDQSEIYASKKISYIIDELIQTEANYVNNLSKGLKNYGRLHEMRNDLPEPLQGPEGQQKLLGNIEEILRLHEQQILPLMLRNQRDLKLLFDEFSVYFDKNQFYCYVIFMMHKKTSMQLRQEQREWFQTLQTELNDKLGIDSFLVQPIQRLTRYPLLLQQFISEFYKSGISCKPVLMSVCKLETRMRRLLEVVNQAEEIPSIEDLNDLNLQQQGYFRRSTECDVYHHRLRKKYRAKIFLFEQCLVCTEVRKRRVAYRLHYPWEMLDLQLATAKSVTVLLRTANGVKPELDLSAPEGISVTAWLRHARRIIEKAHIDAAQRGKFSLPMDLVLGLLAAIWLMWQYL